MKRYEITYVSIMQDITKVYVSARSEEEALGNAVRERWDIREILQVKECI